MITSLQVNLSIFHCALKLFINCIQLRGVTLILQLYAYFLINWMSRSSRRLRLSFIGPGIYFYIRICLGERLMRVLWDTLNHDKIS